jgi:hypothetical protein
MHKVNLYFQAADSCLTGQKITCFTGAQNLLQLSQICQFYYQVTFPWTTSQVILFYTLFPHKILES